MEVHLSPEQEAFIQQRVRTGRFATADKAVQEAVCLLEEQEGCGAASNSMMGSALVAAMQASPYKDIDLEPKRPHLPVHDITL
jgi:putative addiction module CopG family antidote